MGERRENEEAGRWRGMEELLQQPRKQVFVFASAISTTTISLSLSRLTRASTSIIYVVADPHGPNSAGPNRPALWDPKLNVAEA